MGVPGVVGTGPAGFLRAWSFTRSPSAVLGKAKPPGAGCLVVPFTSPGAFPAPCSQEVSVPRPRPQPERAQGGQAAPRGGTGLPGDSNPEGQRHMVASEAGSSV